MAKIMRFGVLKTSSFIGIYSFFIGLIITLIMWIATKFLSNLFLPSANLDVTSANAFSVLPYLGFNWILIFILPFVYGIIGFLSGLIMTPIMNLALRMIKGMDFDLELSGHQY